MRRASRRRRLARACVLGSGVALALALSAPASLRAEAPPPMMIEPAPTAAGTEVAGVTAEIGPLFELGGTGYLPGVTELVVRIRNAEARPVKGQATVSIDAFGEVREVRAPFTVSGASTVTLHLPLEAREALRVEVLTEEGRTIARTELQPLGQEAVRVVELFEPPRARTLLDAMPISPDFVAPSYGGSWSSSTSLRVLGGRTDPTTGAPVLPRHVVGWRGIHAVVAPTELVARLGGVELEALAGFVMGGGTLAMSVSKPEDLRHPNVTALLGGEAARAAAPTEARASLDWPVRPGAAPPVRPFPVATQPGEAIALAGWTGGNLAPSPFGATAPYGLGEVVLLSFDARKGEEVGDPFVQIRLGELARRAYDRQVVAAAPAGGTNTMPYYYGGPFGGFDPYEEIRKQLDPNRTARWGIGVATLLICLYAVIAGPVAFGAAKKRNRPLAALGWLPVLSLATFLVVVALGVASKGLGRRVHHLAFVDAGAGMSRGVVRRYRGFFSPDAGDVSVRATELTGFVTLASTSARSLDTEVDRDGARLVDVETLPAETLVVREDGIASIGDGISVVPQATDDVIVKNRTGRSLRGIVVRTVAGQTYYHPSLADGDEVSTTSMSAGSPKFRAWSSSLSTRSAGALMIHDLATHSLEDAFGGEDERELGEAWTAIAASAGEGVDWFPDGVPVVLAQVDGGEGMTKDAGLPVERARLLVRVVGWGGRP